MSEHSSSGRWQLVQAATIAVAVLVAYLPALDAGFIWNDDDLTAILALIRQRGLSAIWFSSEAFNYWPVTWTSYWLEHQVFGNDPATGLPFPTSYHVVNVIVHALSCLVLWRILEGLEVPGGWLIAAVFAVHPVNVESVAWITQRKNVLALFFYLLTLHQYLSYEQTGRRSRMLVAVTCYLLALLSKGSVVSLPLVLLVLAWWRRGRVTRSDLLTSVPFLVMAAVMSGVEIWFQHTRAIGNETIRDAGLAERIMATGPIAWFYLQKSLMPWNLSFVYPLWRFDTTTVSQWLPLGAGLAVLLALVWATRQGMSRAPMAAVLYTLLCLAPFLGLVDIYYFRYSLVADHYLYVALPGILALVVGSICQATSRLSWDRTSRAAASIAIVTLLAGLSWQQATIYTSPQRLWQDTLTKNRGCWLAHNQLGNLVGSSDKWELANDHYREALKLSRRQFGTGHVETARIHNNLGTMLGQASRQRSDSILMDEAIEHLETACRIDPDRGVYVESLAGVLQETGRVERAVAHLNEFLKRHPDASDTWLVLARCLDETGQTVDALNARRRARIVDPRRQQP